MRPLTVEQHIAAPRAAVFGYLVDGERWARWQGDTAEIDPWPGGAFQMVMPDGSNARGEIVEIEQDRRVVFTWGWVGHPDVPPGSTRVEIELVEENGGTRVILTHTALPAGERSVHEAGWRHYLGRLGAIATGSDPGPDAGLQLSS